MAQLFVNHPGNLSDNARRKKLDRMVAEMESLPSAFRTPDATNYFLRDFVGFEELFQGIFEEEEPSIENTKEQKLKKSEINETSQTDVSKTTLTTITISTMNITKNKTLNKETNLTAVILPILKKNESIQLKSKREVNFESSDASPTSINIEKDLLTFLTWPEYVHWATFVKYTNVTNKQNFTETHLNNFMITVGYHGSNLKDWYVIYLFSIKLY